MNSHEFSERVLEMEPMLYRMAYGLLLNRTDCADAVQEALLRAWEKRRQLREEAYFRTWLTRILINQCYNMLRRRRFFLPLDSARTVAAPEGADIALHDAIAHLDNKLRLPIVLHYMEGYSVDEIAEMLSQPSGTIKTRLMRGRKLLRAALEEVDISSPSSAASADMDANIRKCLPNDAASVNTMYSSFSVLPSSGAAVLTRRIDPIDLLLFRFYAHFIERRKSRHE